MDRPRWMVLSRGNPPLEVSSPNWMAALGEALQRLGMMDGLERLACERLASGEVIANDLSGHRRFAIRQVG